MKVEEIREMDPKTISQEVRTLEKELMGLRMENAIGTLENPLVIRHKKRAIARMKTILTEKETKIREAK